MLTTPGILVRSPRTEAAQPSQSIFGTLRLTRVAVSFLSAVVSTTAETSFSTLGVATGVVDPVHPTNASNATCNSTAFLFMSFAPELSDFNNIRSLESPLLLSARVKSALNTVFSPYRANTAQVFR